MITQSVFSSINNILEIMEQLTEEHKYKLEEGLNHLAYVLQQLGVEKLEISSTAGNKFLKWDCFENGMVDSQSIQNFTTSLRYMHKNLPFEFKTTDVMKRMNINDLEFYLEVLQEQPEFGDSKSALHSKMMILEDELTDIIKNKYEE